MKYELNLNQDGFYYIDSENGRGIRIQKFAGESPEAYKERAIQEFDKHIELALAAIIKKVNNTSTAIKTAEV